MMRMIETHPPKRRRTRPVQLRDTRVQVKIFQFVLASSAGSTVDRAEEILAEYLTDGWVIVAAGGAGGDSGAIESAWAQGFVVLQRQSDAHEENRVPAYRGNGADRNHSP
jgi:hypothetical protein